MSPLFRRGSRRRRSVLPPPGTLRRERRALLTVREEKLRDLGGLVLEMFRSDRFREDLVAERCQELLELDARLAEVDAMLDASLRRTPLARCSCGAPLPFRAHFCPNCGRPAGAVVVACSTCGHALPADAAFCPQCGTSAATARPVGVERPLEAEAHDG